MPSNGKFASQYPPTRLKLAHHRIYHEISDKSFTKDSNGSSVRFWLLYYFIASLLSTKRSQTHSYTSLASPQRKWTLFFSLLKPVRGASLSRVGQKLHIHSYNRTY